MPSTRTSIDSSPKVAMSNGRGTNHVLVSGDGLNNISVQVQEFEVGAPYGRYHMHRHSDNVYLVLSGTVSAFVDGETQTLVEGDLLFIPAGVAHKTTNGGDQVARALEIYAPPPVDDTHQVDEP